MERSIQLLDCTLRDGGNGLEELEKNGNRDAAFYPGMITRILSELQKSKAEIIEIGSIQRTEDDRRRFAQYQTIEEISLSIPPDNKGNQLFAAIFRGPDEQMKNIPVWREGLCKAVRVVLRYSELKRSLDFCRGVAEKGYQVFIQPMVTMRYTRDDLKCVADAANEMGAYAVYFVDSYGCMDTEDIDKFLNFYMSELKPEIKIGFHAHNNMNMAFVNAVRFMEGSWPRNIIVDACVLGMGLGAGNLQTELLANHLNKVYGKNYDMESIICACEIMNPFFQKGMWGYGLEKLVPALQKTAYKYSAEYQNEYSMPMHQIYNLLTDMPDEYRFRFTKEYAGKWLEQRFGRRSEK